MEAISVLTQEQISAIVDEAVAKANNKPQDSGEAPAYVYGLRGIMELFKVSHPTAQRYKNTFLAPAIIQRGRKIMVDASKAVELFNTSGYGRQ